MIISRKEARQENLKTYFDGEPCERGHVAERLTISGRCCECIEEDNLIVREQKEDFVARKVNKKNKAKEALNYIKETAKELNDREKWYLLTNSTDGTEELDIFPRSRELAKELGEDFYDDGQPCKRNHLSKRYTSTGKCVACEKHLRDEYKPYIKVYAHERRARFRDAEGFFNKSDIDILYQTQDGLCKYCHVSLDSGYHIDHRIPLAKGGSNWPENLQLLCPPCNLKKKDKMPEQFEKEIGYKENEK